MVKIGFRFIERALLDFHVGFCLMKVCHCLIQIGLRRSFPGKKFLGPRGIQFCELQRSLRISEIAFRLSDRCLKKRWIDLGHDLACFYLRIKIGEQLRDVPRNLAANLDVNDRIERARCGYCLCNRAACDSGDLIIFRAAAPALPHHGSDNEQPNDQSDPRDKSFHLCGS